MNAPGHPDRPEPTPGGLMADMLSSVSRLVQGELALLRAETRQRAQSLQKAILFTLLAAVLGITALNVLASAAVTGVVALGVAPHWATLIVGVVVTLVAAAFAMQAMRLLRAATAGPLQAARNVKRDVETLQAMVNQDVSA